MKRGDHKPRWRDVEPRFIRRIAEAFFEGAAKYERDLPPYEKNWHKADLEAALDVLDHAFEHLAAYSEIILNTLRGTPENIPTWVDQSEDHLGHLGANLAMLAKFEELGLFDQRPAVQEESEDVNTEKLSEKIKEFFGFNK
jgi:hypothetical protein